MRLDPILLTLNYDQPGNKIPIQTLASSSEFRYINVLLDEILRLDDNHRRSKSNAHLEILFGETTIAGIPFLPLKHKALTQSGTKVQPWKIFRRLQTALNLLRYFEHSLTEPNHVT